MMRIQSIPQRNTDQLEADGHGNHHLNGRKCQKSVAHVGLMLYELRRRRDIAVKSGATGKGTGNGSDTDTPFAIVCRRCGQGRVATDPIRYHAREYLLRLTLPALVLACWRGVASCLSGPSCARSSGARRPNGMVPQQWPANITPAGVVPEDRCRLDLIVYGATRSLCVATRHWCPPRPAMASPRMRQIPGMVPHSTLPGGGKPHAIPSSAVLAAEVGGRWSDEAQQCAPPALRAAASQGWVRRWWSILAVAVQRAVCSAELGTRSMPAIPGDADAIPVAGVLDLAEAALPSCLPLR